MHRIKCSIAAILVATLVFAGIAPATNAQEGPTGSGLSISPTLSQFTIKPGASDTVDITLKNITINNIVAQAYINDFTSDGTTGNAKIINDPNTVSPNSIRPFVVGLSNVPLQVQEQKIVTLTLKIPSNARPGAYYGIIRYKAVPASAASPQNDQVSLSASVGTIILITVPGNLKQQVQLSDLLVYNSGNAGTIFFRKPDHIGVQVKNLGNDFAQPYGTVEVQNIRGKEVYTYQLNNKTPRSNVLPSSSRIFLDPLKGVTSAGRYTVTASVTYGNGGTVLVLKKTFWYLPTKVFIIILVILAVLLLVAYRAYRRYKQDVRRSYRRRD